MAQSDSLSAFLLCRAGRDANPGHGAHLKIQGPTAPASHLSCKRDPVAREARSRSQRVLVPCVAARVSPEFEIGSSGNFRGAAAVGRSRRAERLSSSPQWGPSAQIHPHGSSRGCDGRYLTFTWTEISSQTQSKCSLWHGTASVPQAGHRLATAASDPAVEPTCR